MKCRVSSPTSSSSYKTRVKDQNDLQRRRRRSKRRKKCFHSLRSSEQKKITLNSVNILHIILFFLLLSSFPVLYLNQRLLLPESASCINYQMRVETNNSPKIEANFDSFSILGGFTLINVILPCEMYFYLSLF